MSDFILAPGEKLFTEKRTATFRKENFEYTHTGIIDRNGDAWTTTGLDEANLFQVYNQYRTKHGIPFPDEIAGLRRHYGLSALKMSQILGFGVNQYRMYEDGDVPSISNARTLIAAREKSVFLSFIEASKAEMSDSEYARIKRKADSAAGDYIPSDSPTEFSGYRSLSLDKIASVVKLMISGMGATFVTKMNKLLFYADFIHYKNHGYGITGLTYRALRYGPVPDSWGSIYAMLPGVSMEEFVYSGGHSGIRIECTSGPDEIALSQQERETVERVCNLFADMTAGEISDASHLEKAWINNHDTRSEISYQYAFEIMTPSLPAD